MSYLPHKVPPTSQLFSSFRELPSAVRMADNPAYDGERRKKRGKIIKKTHGSKSLFTKTKTSCSSKEILFWLSSSDFSIPGEKGGGGGTTGFLSVGNISYN